MKKLILSAAAVVALVLPGAALAFSTVAENAVSIPAGETRQGTLFLAGVQVAVAGTVNGDVICAGSDVSITGTVHGDVICAGQTVTVSGTVDGSVRVAGASVNVGGNIGRNLQAAGQVVTARPDLQVGGDAGFFAENATVNGKIATDVYGTVQRLKLNAEVASTSVIVEQLTLGDEAKISGNMWYTAPDASTFDHSRVAGVVHFNRIQHDQQSATMAALNNRLYWIAAALLIAVLLVVGLPQALRSLTGTLRHQPGSSLGFGALAMFGGPFMIAVIAATVIGLPAAALLAVFFISLVAVSPILAGTAIAAWVMERTGSANSLWWAALTGAAGAVILAGIPVVGPIFVMLSAISVTGAVIVGRFKPRGRAKSSATA